MSVDVRLQKSFGNSVCWFGGSYHKPKWASSLYCLKKVRKTLLPRVQPFQTLGGVWAECFLNVCLFLNEWEWMLHLNITNYAIKCPTFGEITVVNTLGVQSRSLGPWKHPSWCQHVLYQGSEGYFRLLASRVVIQWMCALSNHACGHFCRSGGNETKTTM